LKDTTNWTSKTIKTFLNRLVKKNALGFEMEGRTYLYHPKVREAECIRAERRSFLNKVYNGALQPMLAEFIEDQELSPSEIEELKMILDKEQP
jgi:BlaI family penicillinase repressor